MQDVKVNEICKKFDSVLDKMPELRRKFHEEVKDLLKEELDKNITSSINDENGKIKNFQEAVVGSGGGYAAVHAKKGKTGKDSPGAITNYLENGHRIRMPSGTNKYYKPRIEIVYVDGFHFYEKTRSNIEAKVLNLAEDFANEILKSLE